MHADKRFQFLLKLTINIGLTPFPWALRLKLHFSFSHWSSPFSAFRIRTSQFLLFRLPYPPTFPPSYFSPFRHSQSPVLSPHCTVLLFPTFSPFFSAFRIFSRGIVPFVWDDDGSDFDFLCLLPSAICHLSSVIYHLSSVLCPLSSAICHLSSVICPLSSVLCPLSSAICHLSSVLCHLSSVFCPLSSVLCLLSSFICHLSSNNCPRTEHCDRLFFIDTANSLS